MDRRLCITILGFGGLLIISIIILILYTNTNDLAHIDSSHFYKTKDIIMKRVLTFGDSLTAGYTGSSFIPYASLMKKACPFLQTDSIGMSGWTTGQLLEAKDELQCWDAFHNQGKGLSKALSQTQYDLVCMMAGTNDLGHGIKTEDIKENLKILHEIVIKSGAKSLAIGIPESRYIRTVTSADERRKEVNDFLRGLSERTDGMFYMECPVNYTKELFSYDGLHFSEAGYNHMSQGVLKNIQALPGFEDLSLN